MSKLKTRAIVWSDETEEFVLSEVERLSREFPGNPWTRSAVVRRALKFYQEALSNGQDQLP